VNALREVEAVLRRTEGMCPREVRTEIMGKRRQKKTLLLEMMDRTLQDGDVLWARGIAVVEGTIASLDLESRRLCSYNQSYLTTGVLHFGLLCRRERRAMEPRSMPLR
jgi:hypothetical protein